MVKSTASSPDMSNHLQKNFDGSNERKWPWKQGLLSLWKITWSRILAPMLLKCLRMCMLLMGNLHKMGCSIQSWICIIPLWGKTCHVFGQNTKDCKENQNIQGAIQLNSQEVFSEVGINEIVGVACGTYFPPLVRKEAHDAGVVCVYPSGWRYRVDKIFPTGFEIVR